MGLGQGSAKWDYLPNAHNDFIFAIIGEELGFVGAFAVLALFGTLAYAGLRIAAAQRRPVRLQLVVATSTTWLVGQAAINIGYVVGLLPVTGLPLPLISSGGTSLVVTMFVFGMLANAARARAARRSPRCATTGRAGCARLPAAARRRSPTARSPARRRPGCPVSRRVAADDGRVNVVVAGGGSAGHIEPALGAGRRRAAARPGRAASPRLGTERGLDTTLIPARGYPLELIPPVPLPRKPSADLLRLPGRVRARRRPGPGGAGRGRRRRRRRVRRLRRAARLPRRPRPRADRRARGQRAGGPGQPGRRPVRRAGRRRRARAAAAARARSSASRCAASVTDAGPARAARRRPGQRFGLPADGPVLLVFGGSQGARTLNTALAAALPGLAARRHRGAARPRAKAGRPPARRPAVPGYVAVPYIDAMDLAYAAADAVLGRCGAMTVAEVSAVGLPARLRPAAARQRRAGAQRRAGRRRRRWRAGARRRARPATGCSPSSCRCSTDPARLAAMGAAAPPRPGSADADERLARHACCEAAASRT